MFKKFYCGLSWLGEALQSLLLLATRLYWGFGFFQAGYGKLNDIGATSQFFSEISIPFPTANAYIAGSVECFGGLLLIAGLFSRIITIPLIIVMIVAYLTAHTSEIANILNNPAAFVAEGAFNFLFASLIVFAFGPGKISLDYVICRLFFHKKCSAESSNSTDCQKDS